MYKIVVADDEAVVREGIRDNIPWASLGIAFSGEAEDGLEAYECVKKQKPDILLVDICMPHMDGLELTRLVKETYPKCKVIIVTGYDEFDYAHQAIRLGVDDYVLKPVTKVELVELLKKTVADLDKKKVEEKAVEDIKNQLHESLPVLKEKLLHKLINGQVTKDQCAEKDYLLEIDRSARQFCIALLDIDNFSEKDVGFKQYESGLIHFALLNIINEILNGEKSGNRGIAFKTDNNEIALLLYSSMDMEESKSQVSSLISHIMSEVERNLKFTMAVGVGGLVMSLWDISQSYREARKALDYRFFMGNSAVIYSDVVKQQTYNKFVYPMQMEKDLLRALKNMQKDQVLQILQQIFQQMKSCGATTEMCRNAVIEMLIVMLKAFNEIGVDLEDIFGGQVDVLQEVNQFKNLEEMDKWFRKLYCDMAGHIEQRSSSTKIMVLKIQDYIENNYWSPELTYKKMCEVTHVSSSYLSYIFKKEMGSTFVEYLTRVRIDKSRELLKSTSLRTYEIADKVGYSDPHYFSSIFKKVCGISPTDFREKAGGNVG